MAEVASSVCGVEVTSPALSPEDSKALALSPQAMADQQDGYLDYMESVAQMFQDIAEGKYATHSEAFPEIVRNICHRNFLSFKEWLRRSLKDRLISTA
jgi:UTP:GlnB (protein PII) uridylyltransferase